MTEELVTFETAKLAKEKGFDEECRNAWMEFPGGPKQINAPKDEDVIANIMGIAVKYRKDWDGFITYLTGGGIDKPKPLHNSRLPANAYARPSQDLLERWLRETHHITIGMDYAVGPGNYYAKLVLIDKLQGLPPIVSDTFESAKEYALKRALRLLDNITDKPAA